MKYFCDNCNNLLEVKSASDKLILTCKTCFASYNTEEDDTLRYAETKGGNLFIYKTILSNAVKDPVNLKSRVNCPKCKHTIAKQVRLGVELRLINICESCNFQWVGLK